MNFLSISCRSLLNRRTTALLCILSISMSFCLLLLVGLVRSGAREAFFSTVSGVDLLIGARTGSTNLLLYSVFRLGSPTHNISWQSYRDVAAMKDVAWTVPLSLGDSHRGFRVIGTDENYYRHLQFRRGTHLAFSSGHAPEDIFDVVLGSEVASALHYSLGERISLTHGLAAGGFGDHTDKPFTVVGILERTGTPIDRSLHVRLEGITAIHVDWRDGAPPPEGEEVSSAQARALDLTPATVTAVLVGLRSKVGVFRMQRAVNEYPEEALMAVLPGVALSELWQIVSAAETALVAVTLLAIVSGLVGLMTSLLATLNERRREIAVLRSVGATPFEIFRLLVTESVLLTASGAVLGTGMAYGLLFLAGPYVESRYGLALALGLPGRTEIFAFTALIASGFIAGAVPAYLAYRRSLGEGLTVRT